MTSKNEGSERTRRVVVVTGGSMGIGKEIAKAFVEQGDELVICGRNLAPLEEAAKELAKPDAPVTPIVCDVSDNAAVAGLVETVVDRFGRLDVVVNNAGVYGPIGTVWENPPHEWREAMEINLFGVYAMIHHAAKVMVEQGSGVIINLSGGGATSSKPRYSSYAAAKTGVVRLTEVAAHELSEHGVRVNAIAPGFITTRFHDDTLAAGERAGPDLAKTVEKIESGGDDPRKAAELAVFLASSDAEGITGRLFSAIFDDWRSSATREALRASADLFTLRRIDNFMFQEIPRR